MKNTFFILLMLTLVLCSCTADQETYEETIAVPITSEITEFNPGSEKFCDPNFPVLLFGAPDYWEYGFMMVTYHPDLSEDEIICIRREYFDAIYKLKMTQLQPSDSHVDRWAFWVINPPDQDTNTTICDDPRFTTTQCQ